MIQLPTAESKPEGTVSLILNRNEIWKYGTLSVSPFDWLEAGYFYYRPSDLIWSGNNTKGHYLDKGFNIKFIYRSKKHLMPDIALGLDDFAGTGLFTREYIVATKKLKSYKLSFGIGWGKYVDDHDFNNPFSYISETFDYRPLESDNYNVGGSLAYDKWFRGDVTVFGGLEYHFKKLKNLRLKLEYDPINYNKFSVDDYLPGYNLLRKKNSNINVGLSYQANNNSVFDISFIKGNTLNFTFTYGITFNKILSKKPTFKPNLDIKDNNDSKDTFYLNLLNNLNNNKLLMQTADLDDAGNLDISISTSEHRNAIRSSSYTAYIAKEVSNLNNQSIKTINVKHINAGVELNNITYVAKYFNDDNNIPIEIKIKNTDLNSGDVNQYKKHQFKPIVKFPVVFSSFSPAIVSHIGNPEKFYFGGINLQNISEIQFSRNLLLSTEINLRLYDTFQDTIAGPASDMQHVRTDIVQYLKEDDIHISRMQLDYIWSPYKDFYTKIVGGILEPMYGGYGGELFYKPFNKNFSISAEIFNVKQRTFDQRFNFREYKTTTGHINFGYYLVAGLEANLSFGRYLAKDDGYTLDISRTTKSGFKSGIYFTRTNISSELFGEGSFDKGFYFQFPLDILSNGYSSNYSSIKVSPVTRDGGAKLIHGKDLRGLIYNTTYRELINQWDGFLN